MPDVFRHPWFSMPSSYGLCGTAPPEQVGHQTLPSSAVPRRRREFCETLSCAPRRREPRAPGTASRCSAWLWVPACAGTRESVAAIIRLSQRSRFRRDPLVGSHSGPGLHRGDGPWGAAPPKHAEVAEVVITHPLSCAFLKVRSGTAEAGGGMVAASHECGVAEGADVRQRGPATLRKRDIHAAPVPDRRTGARL
jgi:hypothetical protein